MSYTLALATSVAFPLDFDSTFCVLLWSVNWGN